MNGNFIQIRMSQIIRVYYLEIGSHWAMAMHAVLREEGRVVVEVNASLSMTIALEASDKDNASDGHVLGEDEPVVKIQLGST